MRKFVMNNIYEQNEFEYGESGRKSSALNLGSILKLGFKLKEAAEM